MFGSRRSIKDVRVHTNRAGGGFLLDVLQMYTLWAVRVNGGNGKEKYGDDYTDIYAINRLHFKAAMNNDCDHVRTAVAGRGTVASQRGTSLTLSWFVILDLGGLGFQLNRCPLANI